MRRRVVMYIYKMKISTPCILFDLIIQLEIALVSGLLETIQVTLPRQVVNCVHPVVRTLVYVPSTRGGPHITPWRVVIPMICVDSCEGIPARVAFFALEVIV